MLTRAPALAGGPGDAADLYWRQTVYEAWHGGWWFAHIGGRAVLDFLAEHARLGPGALVLEIGSGLGDSCRYLAAHYGVRALGLELDHRRIYQARKRLFSLAPELASRVRFVEADALTWRPDERFDAVFALDTLMQLEDCRQVLEHCREALAPRGAAVFADILAGPRCTDDARRFVWEEDGIFDLPTVGERRALMRRAGFGRLAVKDLTALAAGCFERVVAAARAHRAELEATHGEERYAGWLHKAETYRGLFARKALVYGQVAAHSGARATPGRT